MTDQDVLQDARRYLAQLHKRRGIILTCVVVCLLVAVLYNYTTRPVYQATTQILIERETPDALAQLLPGHVTPAVEQVLGAGQRLVDEDVGLDPVAAVGLGDCA